MKGHGVSKNMKKGLQILLAVAKKDHPEAMFLLAQYYAAKESGEKDLAKLYYWASHASDLGYKPADQLVKITVAEITELARLGDVNAMYLLAWHYLKKENFKQDPEAGISWLRKAAIKGHPKAETEEADVMYTIAESYRTGDIIPKDLKKAFDWYMAAAVKGSAKAMFRIAQCYQKGESVEKDSGESFCWAWAAKLQGCAEAAQLLKP